MTKDPFYQTTGQARYSFTVPLTVVSTFVIGIHGPHGFVTMDAKEVLTVVTPIAGTVVALALPAVQLAQSVMDGLYESTQDLVKKQRPIQSIVKYLEDVVVDRRRDLSAMRATINFSIASLASGLLGELLPSRLFNFGDYDISPKEFLAAASITTLLVAVAWLLPVVRSGFDLAKATQLIGLLRGAASSTREAPTDALAPVAPQTPVAVAPPPPTPA